MKLYDGGRAPNPRRVQIFMKEKNIELDTQQLDLNALEHKTPEMLAKNPVATVPFLELDDGTVISETMAICSYLEALHPEPCLLGDNPLERAMIEMWNRRIEFGFFLRVAHSFRHLHPGAAVLEGEQVEAWGLKNQKLALDYLSVLDSQLSKNQFIAGDRFSVADITAIVAYQFFKPARISMPNEGVSSFKRWADEVSSRPSLQL
jgi:glutathione S-transferase